MELLDTLTRKGSNESIAVTHRALAQELNRIDGKPGLVFGYVTGRAWLFLRR